MPSLVSAPVLMLAVAIVSKIGWQLGWDRSVELQPHIAPWLGGASQHASASTSDTASAVSAHASASEIPPRPSSPPAWRDDGEGQQSARSRWRHKVDNFRVRTVLADTAMESDAAERVYAETLVHPAALVHEDAILVAIVGGSRHSSTVALIREMQKYCDIETIILMDTDGAKGIGRSRLLTALDNEEEDDDDDDDDDDDENDDDKDDDDPLLLVFPVDYDTPQNLTAAMEESMPDHQIDIVVWNSVSIRLQQSDSPTSPQAYVQTDIVVQTYDLLTRHLDQSHGIFVTSSPTYDDLHLWADVFDGVMDEDESGDTNSKAHESIANSLIQSIQVYMEPSLAGVDFPHLFLIGFANFSSKAEWRQNAPTAQIGIYDSLCHDGDVSADLLHIDGPTLQSYHYPPRPAERALCKHVHRSGQMNDLGFEEYCNEKKGSGYDMDTPAVTIDQLAVRKSAMGENSGRGVFTEVDIPTIGTYIGIDVSGASVRYPPPSVEIIETFEIQSKVYGSVGGITLLAYMNGYGFTSQPLGEEEANVDANPLTFINHGCNGTFNVGSFTTFSEQTKGIDEYMKKAVVNRDDEEVMELFNLEDCIYDPFAMRDSTTASATATTKPLKAGDELLDNYLGFIGDLATVSSDINDLRNECSGGKGLIEDYQLQHRHADDNDNHEDAAE